MGAPAGLIYHDKRMHHGDVDGCQVQFKYTEPYSSHFKYHHLVDVFLLHCNVRSKYVPCAESFWMGLH